jgi:TolC family type I secretion outer membrane protein
MAICLLACSAARAAEPLPDQPLSLVEATDLAMRNNPSTRSAWAQVRESKAAETIARAGYFPTLSASYSAQRLKQLAFEGTQVPWQTRYGPSVSFSWLLLDFGGRGGAIDRAHAETLAQRLTQTQSIQDLMLTVESAYYAVIGTRGVELATRRSLEEAQANGDAADARRKSGVATIGDVYQAQAALAAATTALQQAEGSRVVAEGALAVALGYPPDTVVQLAEWHPPEHPELPTQTVQQLLQGARDARPELLAAKAREQAAEAAVRQARSENWPTLSATGTASRTTIVDRGTANSYSGGLRVDLPIFSGFSVKGAIEQAKAAVDQSQADNDALRLSVEQQVWVAYQNVQTSRKGLDAARAQLRAADQAADAIRARYRTGLSSILEVLTTEQALAQARIADVQAGINWYQALAQLGHDAGGLAAPASGEQQ